MRFVCTTLLLLLILSNNSIIAQKKETVKDYFKEIQVLTEKKKVKAAFAIIDQLEPQTRKEHIELTEIPAPPFNETARANRFKQLLEDAGPHKVWFDSLGNVLLLRKGSKGGKTIVLDAHLDTVFPEGTDVKVKIKGDTLFAPGIADDTRGLIAILTVLRALENAAITTDNDILFVASLGEEGMGDLRGIKYILKTSKRKIDSWISVDGIGIAEIVNGGLGVVRYRVTYKGPGGHSWGAFGLGNPHHAMAKGINYFSDEAMKFTSNGIKTSFNVGRTGGGTSVNSIPFESWAEVDMRSESASRLRGIDSIFITSLNKGLVDYNKSLKKGPPLTLTVEQIGNRPSGVTPESLPIVQRSMAAAKYFGETPKVGMESTNSNVPIAMGIPAITIGAGGRSNHEHSLGEWWINQKGVDGIKFILLVLLGEAGVSE